MKNTEKNSSKVNNNNNNNDVLSPETIKAQLKAACQEMNAAQTKEYIKGLDGYSIKQTGANPDRTHATIYYGEVRVCNVEQVQGIKADGTARGCISVAKANLTDRITTIISKFATLTTELTADERKRYDELTMNAVRHIESMQTLLDTANSRAAERAAEAAKAKRAEAAKERATKKVGEKIAKSSDNEKIAAIAAALDCDYETAKIIFDKKRAQKTA